MFKAPRLCGLLADASPGSFDNYWICSGALHDICKFGGVFVVLAKEGASELSNCIACHG